MYILIAILLLGILITVHEAGHFLFARLCGIAVKEYAIGMGPKLISRVGKSGTAFSLRLIPMGGYCAFYGEDDLDGAELQDERAWGKNPVWKRAVTVLMGPGMNFLFAYVVLLLWLWIGGVSLVQPLIASVEPGGPAEAAGLRAGDVVLTLDGVDMTGENTDAFLQAVAGWSEGSEPLTLAVRRAEGVVTLSAAPVWDADMGRYRLGVTVGGTAAVDAQGQAIHTPVALGQAAAQAWDSCVWAGGVIIGGLRDLVSTGAGLEDTSGPVGIVRQVSESVSVGGLNAFLNLLVVISINLGIMNLLPIPGLDGSRLLFLLLEAIRRKPIPPQKEAAVNLVGMGLLFALMLLLTFRDVYRIFE